MNEQEYNLLSEQIRKIKDDTMDLLYNPETEEFEFVVKRIINENDIITEMPVSPIDNIGEW